MGVLPALQRGPRDGAIAGVRGGDRVGVAVGVVLRGGDGGTHLVQVFQGHVGRHGGLRVSNTFLNELSNQKYRVSTNSTMFLFLWEFIFSYDLIANYLQVNNYWTFSRLYIFLIFLKI